MNIPIEELKYNRGFKLYYYGFRIVYFYEGYHEVLKNVCVRKKENLKNYCNLQKKNKNISIEEILEKFLENNNKALAVAIYDVKTGKEIIRKYQKNIKKEIKDCVMFREELMYDYGVEYFINGYRLVYFYPNGKYSIGTFSKKIEKFMFEFCDRYPIDNEADVPAFISVDDILDRSLNMWPDTEAVAIYKTDGTCVLKKKRIN